MCEPVTLTALAAGAAAAGGVAATGATVAGLSVGATALAAGSLAMSAVGAYGQAQSARYQADYQSQVAKNNEVMAGYARQDALQRGGEQAVRAQQEARRLRGAQTVRLASNGLDISSGTPLAILEDTDYFGQQDAQMIRNNAARQAWGYQVEGQNYASSAAMYSAAAKANNPLAAGAGSLLSGAAQFAGGAMSKRMNLNADINANIANSGLY